MPSGRRSIRATSVWIILMVGLIVFLRASNRGRTGWEPTTLAVVAILPPVWLCIEMYTHPQDLVAMGLALGAAGCALRDRWVGVGVLVALSVLCQPFGMLVALPLLVVVPPGRRRMHYIVSAVAAVAIVSIPLIALGRGTIAHDIFIGSGNAVVGGGSTVLWAIHLRGTTAITLSRVLPLVVSFLIVWDVVRRSGRAAILHAPFLMALLAVCLGTRLVFEDNLFAVLLHGDGRFPHRARRPVRTDPRNRGGLDRHGDSGLQRVLVPGVASELGQRRPEISYPSS